MKRLVLACLAILAAAPAVAALPPGATAPDFRLAGALGGKKIEFSLDQALRQGPVVLYFFPAAFTAGCTIEAHDFADATATFAGLGASVIGVTAGNVDRVADFSKLECRDKFPVAADPGAVVAAKYETLIHVGDRTLSDRTSFLIAPDGKILFSYTNRDPDTHIQKLQAALKSYRERA